MDTERSSGSEPKEQNIFYRDSESCPCLGLKIELLWAVPYFCMIFLN